MTEFALRLSVPQHPSKADLQRSFYWTANGMSSFEGGFGPRLGKLGPVAAPNVDFARLAALVFAADRTVQRHGGGSNWSQREFELTVPVSEPAAWQAVAADLSALLGFLTGDAWVLTFAGTRPPKETIRTQQSLIPVRRVVLVSGGADSAVGALVSRSELNDEESHVLVSHVGSKTLAPFQDKVAAGVERLVPGPSQQHLAIGLRRCAKQIDGSVFPTESSSRSRSLLFLSLGLAVASIHDAPLWIPENGFASLNPPLAADRRGSLSTRTTHPRFLGGLSQILERVGARHEIHNPFAGLTKGEMFRRAAELVGDAEASSFLSDTHSCAHSGQRFLGFGVDRQCGVCFGCVVRRASFAAAGLSDGTNYVTGDNERVERWLAGKSVVPAMRSFVRRGVQAVDIAAIGLPADYPPADAIQLCQRACVELEGYLT